MSKLQITNGTTITGRRTPGGGTVVMVDNRHTLHHIVHHSPDGFSWGYAGSGPADLALSILELVLVQEDEQRVPIWRGVACASAWRLHQDFKWNFVCGWGESWSITVGEVRKWVASKREPEQVTV